MTREEAKEWLPIIQAFTDGKTIQFRERDIEEPSFQTLKEILKRKKTNGFLEGS